MPHILLYTMDHCPYCKRAKALLLEKGITDWEEYDLEIVPEKRGEMIKRSNGRRTVPQIFINGEQIGGCHNRSALERAHPIDAKLNG